MKKIALAAALATVLSTNVQADALGIYLGGQIWDNQASGTFGDGSSLVDFNLVDEKQNSFFIAFEHPLPLIPNARIASTSLETNGMTTLDTDFDFDDETFLNGADVNADFDVSYVDYTLYYELFDNDLFSFELGLTARDFDGAVTETETITTVTTSNDGALDAEEHPEHNHIVTETTKAVAMGKIETTEIVPMLYVATNISLPLTGLSVFAQGDFLLKDENETFEHSNQIIQESRSIRVNLEQATRYVQSKLAISRLNTKGVMLCICSVR